MGKNNIISLGWKAVSITASLFSLVTISSVAIAQSSAVSIEKSEGTSSISAQDEIDKENAQDKPVAKNVERIKVTGSHIKRIDIEGASPILTLDKADLERSGYNSVADVLRDMSVNSFGSTKEKSGSSSAGFASVNLRGMGANRTLVLMNGRRLPKDGARGAVDLNLVPKAIVQRIEILKDGASATYGSDALGGVVNIITVKDYTGTEVSINGSYSEFTNGDGTRTTPDQFEAGVVTGVDLGKVNWVNSVHYRNNSEVFARDRSWTSNGLSPTSDIPRYRGANADGSYNGNWIVPAGTCPEANQDTVGGNQYCMYRYTDHSTSIPSLKQTSAFTQATAGFGNTSVALRGIYVRKDAAYVYAPSPGEFFVPAGVGPGIPGVNNTNGMYVGYRLAEVGNRETEIVTNSSNIDLTAKTEFGETWEVEYGTAYSKIHRLTEGKNGSARASIINDLVASGVFDPTRPAGQRGDLSSAKYVSSQNMETVLQSAQAVASGEIYESASGPWGLAIGTSYTKATYFSVIDDITRSGDSFDSAGSEGGGVRNSTAVFSELSVPMTQKLEMQVATRYDNYSDFGDTVNPKLAFKYQASKKLLLRTSVGTGFKAPDMVSMYEAQTKGYPTLIDTAACKKDPTACDPRQIETISGGNPGLEQEQSISYNAGAIYQATRDLSFGFDVWKTTLDNVVGIDIQEMLDAEARGANVTSNGFIIERDAQGNITKLTAPTQNLAKRDVFGIDLSQNLRFKRFRFGVQHSHIFHFLEEGSPGAGVRNVVREAGRPQWRNTITVGISPMSGHDASFSYRTIAPHEKAVATKGNRGQYSELDFNYNYQISKSGEISFGVRNLLGTTPPLDETDQNNQLDTTLYSELGSVTYLSGKATF